MACGSGLEAALIREAGRTPEVGAAGRRRARENGSFLLRNALVTSLALDSEDGELGF